MNDMTLLTDYAEYMSEYGKMLAEFETLGNGDMNEDEATYYLKVQTRVNKKLLEIAK